MKAKTVAATLAAAALAAGAAQAGTTVYSYSGDIIQVTLNPGEYVIDAYGAEGGKSIFNTPGGAGAEVGGQIDLSATTTLTMLIGGKGGDGYIETTQNGPQVVGGGGGGGTFVMDGGTPTVGTGSTYYVDGGTPLLVAGGGGGAGVSFLGGGSGVTTNTGTGGGPSSSGLDGGGGGLVGDGGGMNVGPGLHVNGYAFFNPSLAGSGGLARSSNANQNPPGIDGGFGGGGGTLAASGGGGGGYTGGASGSYRIGSTGNDGGEGGGSFVATDFSDLVELAGKNAGDGFVTITSVLPQAVPEPAVWSMLILGFGMIGSALRRRPSIAPIRGA